MESKSLSTALRLAIAQQTPRLTITQLASEIGISYDRLRNMVDGTTRPPMDVIHKVRKALRLPSNWPEVEFAVDKTVGAPSGTTRSVEGVLVSLAGTPLASIPIVGTVSAGEGRHNVDSEQEQVWVPDRLAQLGSLGWIVEGDSMMPALQPGDVAVFKESRSPRKGLCFLVKDERLGLRVKNLNWKNGEWVLESLNPKYPDEPLYMHQLQGVLVGWYRNAGSRETIDSDPNGLVIYKD